MRWLRIRIKTTTEAEDIIISDLYDIGLEGAQIEDNVPLSPLDKERMFVDILPDSGEDDGTAFLNFFVELSDDGSLIMGSEPDGDALQAMQSGGSLAALEAERDAGESAPTRDELLAQVREVLGDISSYMDIGEGTIECSETEDIDWINSWKQYFHSFEIDDILVIPSWEEVPEGDWSYVLHIDPGTAFGTGMHETTQLCIRQARKWVKELGSPRVLDIGTGSGILAILSLMFGAQSAAGTDLDPCAVPAVEENCEHNGIDPERFSVIIGNIIDDKEVQDEVGYDAYDIVFANILAEVLVGVTPPAAAALKRGGVYITSGILNEKVGLIYDAMRRAGLEIVSTTSQGEWSCVVGRKN